MPGRLRRRGCLKPGQPRSASPGAWGAQQPASTIPVAAPISS
jgi:hypothetical protein